MSTPVTLITEGDVSLIRIDNPPVNALSNEVIDGLSRELDAAIADPATTAIVLICAGRTFVAGADITGLQQVAWGGASGAPEMHGLFQRLEDSPKPVVIAMHGTALGGGLELAMAGHYRVASPTAQAGLPETNLGLIPGAEGTQRLPRLVGVEKAIEMVVSGRPVKASDALTLGLIDRIIDGDLHDGALAFARERVAAGGRHPKTRERRDQLPPPEAVPALVAAGQDLARKTRKHLQAPHVAIEAVAAAATLPFEEGCRRERDLFFERCAPSEQTKALIHAFFAERGVAKVPGITKDTPTATIATVGIIGAGTMGAGIAMACANAGISVRLTDAKPDAIEAGHKTIARNYDSSVKRGRFTAEGVAERMARIQTQTGYDGFDQVDLVIEAVYENMALKKEIFATLDAIARRDAILATNTSTLDIDEIASATRRPSQVVGLHFFSPANVMRLVEIVRGAATSASVVASALALAKRLGKVGVVVGNCAGFVGNRMMFPYMYEAQFLVEDGATPEQVDRALTNFGMAMGIFAVDDMGGLDVAWRVRQELHQFGEPGARKPLASERLCELGRFGQKTGSGWYKYEDGRTPLPNPDTQALIEQVRTSAGITARTFTDEEIVERTIYALINEGAKVLDEGFALRAADIDVIYVTGYGFPAFRGGPMFYADRVGLTKVAERIAAFHREHGQRWKPAPLLARLAAEGKTFRELDAERTATPA